MLLIKLIKKKKEQLFRSVLVLLIVLSWLLTGWPGAFNFPPEIKEARAASPTAQSRGTGSVNGTTITVTLSGTPALDDLYLVFLQSNSTGSTWTQNTGTTGWTELYDTNGQSVWYKQIGSGEADPVFAQTANARAGYSVIQITGHEDPATQAPEAGTQSSGSGTTPDPPSITPTGGSKDYLFVTFAGTTGSVTYTAAPTNYVNLNAFDSGGGPNGAAGATAERQLTASTEDPGTFTAGSGSWYANTIAVHPAAAADPTFTQSNYRWYVDNDSENVTDPWGNPDIAQNTAITILPASNDPPSSSQELRLRVNLTVNTADLTASSQQFKLEFREGTDTDCSTGTWTDVAALASSAWQFASSTVSDGTTLTASKLSSDVLEVYSKSNPTATNPNSATSGQTIEYDFHIIGSGTDFSSSTQYLFRVVESDDTAFDAYTNCAVLTTEPGTGDLMRHGNVFSSGSEEGFFWAD